MKILEAAKIARWRFGYLMKRNNFIYGRIDWRKVVRNTKLLCEKNSRTIEDFPL